MKFRYYMAAAVMAVASFSFTSCVKDLEVENINPQQVSDFNQDAIFNKIYANMSLTGQEGPAGNSDLTDIDEGFSSMVRQIWNANELSTDEALCRWGDAGIPEYNHNAWSDNHEMLRALYYRLMFGVTISNFFLDQATGDDAKTLTQRAEARFMRALYYYYLMDLYGNPPFCTTVSSEKAVQYSRAQIFEFIESELKDICEGSGNEMLMDAKTNTYGRADKAAAWMLLARLYLNAEVYTGSARWADAKEYAGKVLNSGYSLCKTPKNGYSAFQLLFMGDNDTNGAQDEIILPAMFDGETTQTWGGTLFIMASTVNTSILEKYPTGSAQQWEGNRARAQFSRIFFPNDDAPQGIPTDVAMSAGDDRALFFTLDHEVEINDETNFADGYAYVKFLNTHADGSTTHHTDYADTDFPMMRLGEAYLTYAEADARLNGGFCTDDGIEKIKALRERANANTSISSFSIDQILNEWAKEFGYEGRRRIDLIRHNKFGGQNNYKWEWMGGSKEGTSFPATRNIFALPASDLTANENLKQNPGY